MSNRQYLASTAAIVALFAGSAVAGSAFAQTAAGGKSAVGLEEVIVTAQKRSENLQDVPIAITSVSAGALQNAGVLSTNDLNMVMPSVSFANQSGAVTAYVRGIGTTIAVGGNESSVATYVDGVYYATAAASVLSLNNISQISVLAGPQGTLFGRNATGGVIQVTTRDPSQQFQGEANATVGNHGTYGASGYLTGGITPDLAADLAVRYYDQTQGFGKNLFNGQDVNKSRDSNVRSKWKAELGPDTTATLIGDYQETTQANEAFRSIGPTPLGPFTGGKYDVNTNIQPYLDVKQHGVSLDLRHNLGPVQLVSITAYRQSKWLSDIDADDIQLPIVAVHVRTDDKQFTEELQLVSTGEGPLKWLVGAYFFDGTSRLHATVGGPIANFLETIADTQETQSIAVFGQGTYAFTDRTSLTAGYRETADTKKINGTGTFVSLNPPGGPPANPFSGQNTIYKPTWRLSLDHKLTDDAMAYISYNRGFKSGGYDPTQIAAAISFNPEQLDAYEIGLKSELFDKRLRFNVAGYYYDYKNPQLFSLVSGLPSIGNGTGAKVHGVDADITARVTKELTLTAGLSALHGEYDDFPTKETMVTPTGVAVVGVTSAKGKQLQNTPDFQVKLGGDYLMNLANENTLDLSVNYSYQSKAYDAPENRLFAPAYSLVNASVTWASDANGHYTVQVWGRNLGDQLHYSEFGTEAPVDDFLAAAPGRTFGATFGMKF